MPFAAIPIGKMATIRHNCALRSANVLFGIAPAAVRWSLYQLAPNRAQADRLVAERLAAPFTADANDFLYRWDASRDYNPAPILERITAALLAINSADDERNPPELGILEPAIKRIRNARYYLVPAGPDTRGHGTTAMAKFWKEQLAAFLESAPRTAKRS